MIGGDRIGDEFVIAQLLSRLEEGFIAADRAPTPPGIRVSPSSQPSAVG